MSDPIKLTDEIVAKICASVAVAIGPDEALPIGRAIRTLRDRAWSVAYSSGLAWEDDDGETRVAIDRASVIRLREVLPE